MREGFWLAIMNGGSALIAGLLGWYFCAARGKACSLIAGYNTKSDAERAAYDEEKLSRDYGRIMLFMAGCWVVGALLDMLFAWLGTVLSWSVFFVTISRHLYRIRGEHFDKLYKRA